MKELEKFLEVLQTILKMILNKYDEEKITEATDNCREVSRRLIFS